MNQRQCLLEAFIGSQGWKNIPFEYNHIYYIHTDFLLRIRATIMFTWVKIKGKGYRRTDHEEPEWEQMYTYLLNYLLTYLLTHSMVQCPS